VNQLYSFGIKILIFLNCQTIQILMTSRGQGHSTSHVRAFRERNRGIPVQQLFLLKIIFPLLTKGVHI
jgi:hypothetical protein